MSGARMPTALAAWRVALLAGWLGCSTGASAGVVGVPTVRQNPNPAAPLPALVTVTTDEPVALTVEVSDPQRRFTVDYPRSAVGRRELPLLGLRADTVHRIRVRAEGGAWSAPVDYRTPPLPRADFGFPPFKVITAVPARMEPGFTLLSVRRAPVGRSSWFTREQQRFARTWGALVVLDNEGQVVWYYISDSRTAGVKQLHDGNLLLHRADATLTEIDMLGNIVRQWYPERRTADAQVFAGTTRADAIPIAGLEALHHQPFEMPNGHFLSFGAHSKTIPNYYTSETDPAAPRREQRVVGDRVVEFDRAGRIVWSWDTFDHLDPFRIGYELTGSYWQTRGFPGALDWTHGNGVSYDPSRNLVLASFRHQDASIAIDRASGEIRWILGEPTDWGALAPKVLTPVGPLRWPYHAHNPRFTPRGTVIMFDNGTWGARPFRAPVDPAQHASRAVEFEIDEKAMTVRQIWSSGDQRTDDSCSTIAMSDAWRLPTTDNILAIFAMCLRTFPGMTWNDNDFTRPSPEDAAGRGARIREYTRTSPSQIVFEVQVRDPNDLVSWEVYGGQRIKTLYPATLGRATPAVSLPP